MSEREALPSEANSGLVGSAIQAITQHIQFEGLQPGDLLPSEAAMTRRLNVSRGDVGYKIRKYGIPLQDAPASGGE